VWSVVRRYAVFVVVTGLVILALNLIPALHH